MSISIKRRYISSAFLLVLATASVKVISAVYKIPLTAYTGAVGRGYFSAAYNLYLPIHALTMGAFPLALTKLLSQYEAKSDMKRISALRKASKKLFFFVGIIGMLVMLVSAKPYAHLVADGDRGVYTIIALAPSVFFSCLCACDRAFCEGYMDMKCTAVSQIIEALIKTIFGLLFARIIMSTLLNEFLSTGKLFGSSVQTEEEALLRIYPLTSAAAMLGVTLGSFVSFVFAYLYTNLRYKTLQSNKTDVSLALNELVMFSVSLVGATVVQSVSAFAENFSIQYCLGNYDPVVLAEIYNTDTTTVSTYVYGIYSTVLDFKNLVPGIVMALGVAAVPAISSAYESSEQRFSHLVTSIFKYSALLSVCGGVFICLFSEKLLTLFYSNNEDIVGAGKELLFYMGATVMPCCLASTAVFCTQALGFSKYTIAPFCACAIVRVGLNFILIPDEKINVLSAVFSSFCGYIIITVWNFIIIAKETNCSLNYFEIIIKPASAGVISYYATGYVLGKISVRLSDMMSIFVGGLIFVTVIGILFVIFKCIRLKDIKFGS